MNKFRKLEKLFKEKKKYENLVSENLKTLQDRYKHRKVNVIRDGKEVEVTEKILWDEIWHLGPKGHEASKIMREKYPDLFILVDKDIEIAEKISQFTLRYFGFDHKAMTLSNYISLTKELIKNEIFNINFISKIILVQTILVILGFLIRGIF